VNLSLSRAKGSVSESDAKSKVERAATADPGNKNHNGRLNRIFEKTSVMEKALAKPPKPSKKLVTWLEESEYNKKNELRGGLKNRNVALRNGRNKAEASVETLEKKVAKVEEDVVASSIAVEECYGGYCAKIVQDMTSLREAYEHNVNSIVGLYAPIGDGASSADDFLRLRWLHCLKYLPAQTKISRLLRSKVPCTW
jgi:hypothetical protein